MLCLLSLTQTICDQYSMIDQSRDKSPLTQKFDIFSLKSIKITRTLEMIFVRPNLYLIVRPLKVHTYWVASILWIWKSCSGVPEVQNGIESFDSERRFFLSCNSFHEIILQFLYCKKTDEQSDKDVSRSTKISVIIDKYFPTIVRRSIASFDADMTYCAYSPKTFYAWIKYWCFMVQKNSNNKVMSSVYSV